MTSNNQLTVTPLNVLSKIQFYENQDRIVVQADPFAALESAITVDLPQYSLAVDVIDWINSASKANLGYIKDRQELFGSLNAIIGTLPEPPAIFINWTDTFWELRLTQIRTFLMSKQAGGRNNQMEFSSTGSDATLAFDKAIQDMRAAICAKTHINLIRANGDIMAIRSTPLRQHAISIFLNPSRPATPSEVGEIVNPDLTPIEESDNEDVILPQSLPPATTNTNKYANDDQGAIDAANVTLVSRIFRTRIDVNHVERKLDALIATTANNTNNNNTTPPAQTGGLTPAQQIQLNRIDTNVTRLARYLGMGNVVAHESSLVYPPEFDPIDLIRPQSTILINQDFLEKWQRAQLHPHGTFVFNDNTYTFLSEPIQYRPGEPILMALRVHSLSTRDGMLSSSSVIYLAYMPAERRFNIYRDNYVSLPVEIPSTNVDVFCRPPEQTTTPPVNPPMANVLNITNGIRAVQGDLAVVKNFLNNFQVQLDRIEAKEDDIYTSLGFSHDAIIVQSTVQISNELLDRVENGSVRLSGTFTPVPTYPSMVYHFLERPIRSHNRRWFAVSTAATDGNYRFAGLTSTGALTHTGGALPRLEAWPDNMNWPTGVSTPIENSSTNPPTPGANWMREINATYRMALSSATQTGSERIIVQASLSNNTTQDFKIADVEQIIEAPTERTTTEVTNTARGTTDAWDVDGILSRPALIASETWGNQAMGTTLMTVNFPGAWLTNIESNTHFSRMLNSFNMTKMDVVFRLMCNATPMYGGILAMYFDFFDRLSQNVNGRLSAVQASNYDPVYLDLSKGTVAEFKVPFSAVSQYLSKQHAPFSTQFLGNVNVVTMSNLSRILAAPPVQVRLFAFLESVDVAVLQQPDDRDFIVPQASIVKNVTSNAHSYIPNMHSSYPLALTKNYQIKRENSCRVEDIAGVYGLIRSVEWSTNSTELEPLATVDVHPMVSFPGPALPNPPPNPIPPRFIEGPKMMHLGRHFCYWNGTIEYKLEIACSNLHTGKLMVVYNPGSSIDPTGADARTSNPHLLLDVKENHEIEFSMPFISPTPWKPTYITFPFGDIAATRTGRIRIFSADPIKTGMAGNSIVTVNLYARAGRDFQYAVPRNGLSGPTRYGSTITQSSFLTSVRPNLRMNNEDFNDLYTILRRFISPGQAGINAPNGETAVIPVMPIRPNEFGSHALGLIAKGFAFWRGSLHYKIKVVGRNMTAFEVIHMPLHGMPANIGNNYFVLVPTQASTANTGSMAGSQTFHADVDKEWEIEVPFYSMYEWLHLPLKTYALGTKLPLFSTHNGCLLIRPLFAPGTDEDLRPWAVTVTMAIGEDFSFGAPTAFPAIPLNGSGLGNDVIVVQSAVPTQVPEYPLYVNNPLLKEVYDTIPEGHIARSSRRQFGRYTYSRCEVCCQNVVTHKHEQRCTGTSEQVSPQGVVDSLTVDKQGLVDAAKDFMGKLAGTNNLAHSLVNGINDELSEGSAAYLIDVLTKVSHNLILDAKESAKLWFTKLFPEIDWKLFISSLVAGFTVYHLRDKLDTLAGKLILAGLTSLATHKFLTFASDYVKNFNTPAEEEEESHIRVQNGIAPVHILVQLCCGVLLSLLNFTTDGGATYIFKKVGDMGRHISGIKSGVEAINIFTNFIGESIVPGMTDAEGAMLTVMMEDALVILKNVDDLNLEEMKVRCLTEDYMRTRVLLTYDSCRKLYETAMIHEAKPNIMIPLQRAMEKMGKLRTEVQAFKGNVPFRIDPFHISLYGKPGVGKSACMAQVVEDMRAVMEWPEENLTYSRNADTVYWDGYHGQTFVTYDDLGQVAVDGPCDLTELIGIKSNNPYQVHMASLADKGKFFTSKALVSATNVMMFNQYGTLRDPGSFHRRRNVLVEMIRKENPATGELQAWGGGPNNMDHALFRFIKPEDGSYISGYMSYEDMMEITLKHAKAYYKDQDDQLIAKTKGMKPSTVAMRILKTDRDLNQQTIPGYIRSANSSYIFDSEEDDESDVDLDYEYDDKNFIICDAKAQALFDEATPAEQAGMLKRWSDAFRSAVARRDFAALANGLSYESRMRIANALKNGIDVKDVDHTFELGYVDGAEAFLKDKVAALLKAHENAILYHTAMWQQVRDYTIEKYNMTAEVMKRLSDYFGNLWSHFDKHRRKYIATAIVGMGLIGIASTMTHYWTTADGVDRTQNELPIEAFIEGDYTSKNRTPGNMRVEVIAAESGIDDYKNRKGTRKLFRTEPESGIDDYKNRKGTRKLFNTHSEIHPEGFFGDTSTNAIDVPDDIMELSEEEMIAKMQSFDSDPQITRKVATLNMTYDIECDVQATTDPDCAEFMDNTLLDNLCLVYCPKTTMRMKGLLLEDRFLAVPKHFFLSKGAEFTQGMEFRVRVREKCYAQVFDKAHLAILEGRDIAIYLLSARVCGARSIMKRISTRLEHARYKTTDGNLFGLAANQKGDVWVKQRSLSEIHVMATADHKRVHYKIGDATHTLRGFRYYADTRDGECGSILLQNNRFMASKIIGFHVAASSARLLAFSEMLVREELQSGIDVITKKLNYVSSGSSQTTLELMVDNGILVQSAVSPAFKGLSENIDIAGALAKPLVKRGNTKTDIRKSPIFDVIDVAHRTEPAILDHKDPRCPPNFDPLVSAVSKYGEICNPFPPEHIRAVVDHLSTKLKKYKGVVNKRILSLDEAINGIPEMDYVDSMNMNSAEGAFWNQERPVGAHSKKWMFEQYTDANNIQKYKISHKPLLAKIIHRIQEAKEGRRVLSVGNECLKDERRGLNKIYAEKPGTRSFSILPIDYNIVCRMYFMDFAAMTMKNRDSLSPQCGINPCSIEWTSLIMRLRAKAPNGFDGDFANFDGREIAELMKAQCDVINNWYNDGPINAQIRHTLMGEAFDRYTIVHNGVIHIEQGLPSGFILTVIINSWNNEAYKYLAWLGLAPPHRKALTNCDDDVESITYGDDNDHAVVDETLEWFNIQTIGRYLESYGVTYTDGQKNHWSKAEKFRPIEQTSFLKRLFVPHPDMPNFYRAPLEKKSIEERLLWICESKFANHDELLQENIKNSMQDAYQWGPVYFHELQDKIEAALSEVGKTHLMSEISYTGEEMKWFATVPGVMDYAQSKFAQDVFGV